MEIVIPLVVSIVVIAVVLLVLSSVKTPRYRIDYASVEEFLVFVVTGQATENDWSVFTSLPILHNEALEQIRLSCLEIEERFYLGRSRKGYLLNQEGLDRVQELLIQLQASHGHFKP